MVLAPPRVIPDEAQHYINQGGMELVTFTASGSWNEAGVRVGKYSFPQFPAARQQSRSAVRDVRLSLGFASRRDAAGVTPAMRREPKPPRISGSSCFPRNFAYAISS